MIPDRDIIIVAQPSWEGDYMKAIVEIAKSLSETNRVLYVEVPETVNPLRGSRKEQGLFRVHNSLYHFVPHKVTPINGLPEGIFYERLLQFNQKRLLLDIDKVVASLDIKNPILINGLSPYSRI